MQMAAVKESDKNSHNLQKKKKKVSTLLLWLECTHSPVVPWDRTKRAPSLWASSPGRSVAGREEEGELATTSLEFEYLHRKSRCGDDISNGVITLGTCFSMFVYIRPPFSLRADWRKSDSSVDGEPQGNWRWNSNSRDVVASSYFLFPPSCQSAP